MMSRHFALNSELTGAIAKRLPHAKNQPSASGSFFNQFVTDIYIYIYISLRSPGVTMVYYKADSISKYVCPTGIIDFARKITEFVNF